MRIIALVSAVVLVLAAPAHAGTITETISFVTGTSILVPGPGETEVPSTGPVISGTYTLTFDPTVSYYNPITGAPITSGLTVDSFSYPFSAPLGLTGFTSGVDGATGQTSTIDIEGFQNFPRTVSSEFYDLQIENLDGILGPEPYATFSIADPATGFIALYSNDVTLTITPDAASTPEPISVALFATGLLGIIGVARRRIC